MKNIKAIDKIISELSLRDYRARYNTLTKSQKRRIIEGRESFGYSLGADTLEAVQLKRDYNAGVITEAEYKSFCLKYNLLTRGV